jgi:hypothetical protein
MPDSETEIREWWLGPLQDDRELTRAAQPAELPAPTGW